MQPVVNRSLIHRKSITPPVVTTMPSIAGDTAVGSILTLTPGVWTGADSVAQQWLADGIAIVGGTGLTHTTTADEAGKTIDVEETATNASGSAIATTNAIRVDGPVAVIPYNYTNPALATIPTNGQLIHGDNALSKFNFSKTDADNRVIVVGNIQVGTRLEFNGEAYIIQLVQDFGTYFTLTVDNETTQPDGRYDIQVYLP